MKKYIAVIEVLFSLMMTSIVAPYTVYAEDTSAVTNESEEFSAVSMDEEEESVVLNEYYMAEEESWSTLGGFLLIVREYTPYIGVALFILGVVLFVFSIKNKGLKRFGIRMAVIEVIATFIIFVAVSLFYDSRCSGEMFGFEERPEVTDGYEAIYFDNLDKLIEEGQSVVLFGEGWGGKLATAGRKCYMDMFRQLIFVSIGVGIIFMVITKRDKVFRRWSFVGLCVIIPIALAIGYRYIKL